MKHAISRSIIYGICGVLGIIIGTPMVGAQVRVGGNCTITWDANTEVDLAGYRLYGIQNGVTKTLDVAKPTTSSGCAALGIQAGGPFSLQIDAVDDLGNRSAKAPVPPLQAIQDIAGPTQPSGLTVTPNP